MKAGFWEILLIVILVLILFGHSKIPDLMKNLANGINIFKKELKTTKDKIEEAPIADKKASVKNKAAIPTASDAAPAVRAVKAKPTAKKSGKAKSLAK